ncbi:hypothetical protein Peur_046072 [Populus x canadensis]
MFYVWWWLRAALQLILWAPTPLTITPGSLQRQCSYDVWNDIKDCHVPTRVITDRDTGRSRGFGFVSYESTESASEALSAMDGQVLGGRNIRVSYATEKRQPQPYNSNYGGNPDY